MYGFDKNRSEAWIGELKPWELALCDHLAGDLMDEMNLLYTQPCFCETLGNSLKKLSIPPVI